jgi:hypothetical protein
MTHRQKTPSASTRRSSADAPSAAEGLPGRRAADGAKRKRGVVQWILLIAILILPW